MRTIASVQQKGGVGKSTISFHIAGEFAKRGLRVLLVDMDQQGSLSEGFFGPAVRVSLKPAETVAALFNGNPSPEQIIRPTPVGGISIAPANAYLDDHRAADPEVWRNVLGDFLGRVGDRFDVCLIDCPPSIRATPTVAALWAADAAVIPVQLEKFGSQGVPDTIAAIDGAHGRGAAVVLAGLIPSRLDRRQTGHNEVLAMLRRVFGKAVFDAVMPEAAAFKNAVAAGLPVGVNPPTAHSLAAEAAAEVATEMMRRCGIPSRTRKAIKEKA